MATIDELMEGKKPGEIKVRRRSWSEEVYFTPYFKEADVWYGLRNSYHDFWSGDVDEYEIYREPKPKVRRYLWAFKSLNDKQWMLETTFATEEEYKSSIAPYTHEFKKVQPEIYIDCEE